HAVMDALMQARMADNITDLYDEAKLWIGTHFHDRGLTQEHLDTLIYPALDALTELEIEYGGNFKVVGIEVTCEFPNIPSGFGTVDLVLQSPTHVLVVDYKFGFTEVSAVSENHAGAMLNSQLAYYACAAQASFPNWFSNQRSIAVAIIQPRSAQPLSYTEVDRMELKQFAEDVVLAVSLALVKNPPRVRGEWCKHAPCKIDCPLWTGPIRELALLVKDKPPPATVEKTVTPYGEHLARVKELTELVATFTKEVDQQLVAYLQNGGIVPGWDLAPKKRPRQWIDESTVRDELRKLGFSNDEIWQAK